MVHAMQLRPCAAAIDAESRNRQRTKQILIGKSTIGYINYVSVIPPSERVRGQHMDTPPVSPRRNSEISKREFERMLRVWRQFLHSFDHVGPPRAALFTASREGSCDGSESFGCSSSSDDVLTASSYPAGSLDTRRPAYVTCYEPYQCNGHDGHNIRSGPSRRHPVRRVLHYGEVTVFTDLHAEGSELWARVDAEDGWTLVCDEEASYFSAMQYQDVDSGYVQPEVMGDVYMQEPVDSSYVQPVHASPSHCAQDDAYVHSSPPQEPADSGYVQPVHASPSQSALLDARGCHVPVHTLEPDCGSCTPPSPPLAPPADVPPLRPVQRQYDPVDFEGTPTSNLEMLAAYLCA
eukprot:TRINITY_DN7611_c0_g1_i1.p1 TRINITY_DN7611_c0_g1~~TRINITY_DN7611_c0_g1_i1.p1  ORF type:complete len:374 (+),score=114.13 TRINITY_DN7611_c0_g1_i1:78-1124(+)